MDVFTFVQAVTARESFSNVGQVKGVMRQARCTVRVSIVGPFAVVASSLSQVMIEVESVGAGCLPCFGPTIKTAK